MSPDWHEQVSDFLHIVHRRLDDELRAVLDIAQMLTDYEHPKAQLWHFAYDMPSAPVDMRVEQIPNFRDNRYTVVVEQNPPVMWHQRIVPWGVGE